MSNQSDADPWDDHDTAVKQVDYHARAQRVYWSDTFPACREFGGSHWAQCLLNPRHTGMHYGNGHDEFGPRNPISWPHPKEGDDE